MNAKSPKRALKYLTLPPGLIALFPARACPCHGGGDYKPYDDAFRGVKAVHDGDMPTALAAAEACEARKKRLVVAPKPVLVLNTTAIRPALSGEMVAAGNPVPVFCLSCDEEKPSTHLVVAIDDHLLDLLAKMKGSVLYDMNWEVLGYHEVEVVDLDNPSDASALHDAIHPREASGN